MTLVTGKTYMVRDELRDMGGRWNPDLKGWEVPDEWAAEARALVEEVGGKEKRCKTCRVKINYGYYCGKCEFSY